MADSTDKVRQLQSELEATVAALVTGDDWQAMLQTASKFHKYSAGNVMLIMRQAPDATRVAGYRTWQSLGRQVRKGEHGIRVLAPCRYKTTDKETGDERMVVRGFTTATVFDIAQTDGDELPDMIRPELLEGQAPEGMWDALAKQVASAGFMLERGDCGSANGCTDFTSRTVKVRADVGMAQACKTLAHELAHITLGHGAQLVTGCRGVLEVEAESVAYIVAQAAGMATSTYSAPYVAHWSGGDVTTVRKTAEHVVTAAAAILAALLTGPGHDPDR